MLNDPAATIMFYTIHIKNTMGGGQSTTRRADDYLYYRDILLERIVSIQEQLYSSDIRNAFTDRAFERLAFLQAQLRFSEEDIDLDALYQEVEYIEAQLPTTNDEAIDYAFEDGTINELERRLLFIEDQIRSCNAGTDTDALLRELGHIHSQLALRASATNDEYATDIGQPAYDDTEDYVDDRGEYERDGARFRNSAERDEYERIQDERHEREYAEILRMDALYRRSLPVSDLDEDIDMNPSAPGGRMMRRHMHELWREHQRGL